jgi:hypothetical protein
MLSNVVFEELIKYALSLFLLILWGPLPIPGSRVTAGLYFGQVEFCWYVITTPPFRHPASVALARVIPMWVHVFLGFVPLRWVVFIHYMYNLLAYWWVGDYSSTASFFRSPFEIYSYLRHSYRTNLIYRTWALRVLRGREQISALTVLTPALLFHAKDAYNEHDIVRDLTDYGCFLLALRVSEHPSQTAAAFAQFSRSDFGGRCAQYAVQLGWDLGSYLSTATAPLEPPTLQAESGFVDITRLLSHNSSSLIARLVAIGSAVMLKRFFGFDPDLAMFKGFLQKSETVLDLGDVAASVVGILRGIHHAFQNGDYKAMFLLRTPSTWMFMASDACTGSLTPSLNVVPEKGKNGLVRGDGHYWLSRLMEVEQMYSTISGIEKEPGALGMLTRVQIRIVAVEAVLAGHGSRPQPLVISLLGPPGLGKTEAVHSLASAFLARQYPGSFTDPATARTFVEACKWVYVCGSVNKYDTGLTPNKLVVHLDDIHNLPVGPGLPTLASHIVRFANIVMTHANVAEVELKANAIINAQVLFMTSNYDRVDTHSFTTAGLGRRVTCSIGFEPNPAYLALIERPWSGETDIFKHHAWYAGEDVQEQCIGPIDLMTAPRDLHQSRRVLHSVAVGCSDPDPGSSVFCLRGRRVVYENVDFARAMTAVHLLMSKRWSEALAAHARGRKPLCPFGISHDVCDCDAVRTEVEAVYRPEFGYVDFFSYSCALACVVVACRRVWAYFTDLFAGWMAAVCVIAIRDPVLLEALLNLVTPLGAGAAAGAEAAVEEGLKRRRLALRDVLKRAARATGPLLMVCATAACASMLYKGYTTATKPSHAQENIPVSSGKKTFEAKVRAVFAGQGGTSSRIFSDKLAPYNDELREWWKKLEEEPRAPTRYHLSMASVDPATPHDSTTCESDFRRLVLTNTKTLAVLDSKRTGFALKLSGGAGASLLTNRHTLCAPTGELMYGATIEFAEGPQATALRFRVILTPAIVLLENRTRDLVVLRGGFESLGAGVASSLWGCLSPFQGIAAARVDGKRGVAHFTGLFTPQVVHDERFTVLSDQPCIEVFGFGGLAGDCGMPYIGRVAGKWVILGIHVSSMSDACVVLPVTAGDLSPLGLFAECGNVLAPSTSQQLGLILPLLGPLNRRSLFGQQPLCAQYVGSYKTFESDKSKVVPTSAYDLVPGAGQFCPPFMGHGVTLDGQYVSPGLNKFSFLGTASAAPRELALSAADDYLSGFVSLPQRRPLDFESAVVGLPGRDPYRSFNLSTASGAPYNRLGAGKKRELFSFDPVFEAAPALASNVERLICELARGPVWISSQWKLKDEPRKLTKRYKTRVFSVVPADINLVLRMYFLPIIEVLRADTQISEVMTGVNATSCEWSDMVTDLCSHPNYMMGDMENFDSSHAGWMFETLAYLCSGLGAKLGYTTGECVVLANLVLSCPLQVVDFCGDVFLLNTGLASGLAVTTLVNSLALAILMRMSFATCFPHGDYRALVRSKFYGDDSAMSVADSVVGLFNQRTIAGCVALWGYRYTSALKDGVLAPTEPFDKMQFLKRGMLRHRIVPGFVAPLEEASFSKALAWRLSDTKVGDLERLCQVVPLIWREAWLHNQETFDKWDIILRRIDAMLHLSCVFPSESELLSSYERSDFVGWYD